MSRLLSSARSSFSCVVASLVFRLGLSAIALIAVTWIPRTTLRVALFATGLAIVVLRLVGRLIGCGNLIVSGVVLFRRLLVLTLALLVALLAVLLIALLIVILALLTATATRILTVIALSAVG